MRNLVATSCLALSLAFAGSLAYAQDATTGAKAPPAAADAGAPEHGKFRQKFEAANTTKDGHLTLAQAQAGQMPMIVKNFDKIDADHKGYVTMDDIHQYRKANRKQKAN